MQYHVSSPLRWCAFIASAFIYAFPSNMASQAVSTPPIVKIFDDATLAVRTNAEFLRDKQGTLTIDSVIAEPHQSLFRRTTTDHPNFGYTSDHIWLRITIRNTLGQPVTRVLDVASSIVDSITFYTPLETGFFKHDHAGNGMFKDLRSMKRRRAVFTLTLAASEQKTYYVRVGGKNPMLLNLILYTPEGFALVEHEDYTFFGFVWGIIWCMILFNGALYLVTLNRLYLIVSLHLGASLLALCAVAGVLGEYVWFDVPHYNTRLLSVSIFLANIFSLFFAQSFCDTRRFAPRLHRTAQVLLALCVAILLASCFGIVPLAISGIFALICIILILAAGYIAARHSPSVLKASYWVYIGSWAICNVGVIIANLAGSSIFPEYGDFISTKVGVFSGGLQIVMESFALSLHTVQAQRQLASEQEQRSLLERERELEHERNLELARINTSILRQQEQLQAQKNNAEQANFLLRDANNELLRQRELLEEQKDVTERINAELQAQYIELEKANREKSEFLGIAAHDLKNPLTGVKGMIEILRSGDDIKPAYLNRMALTMQQSVDRMFDIVRNLLDVNAIEQGAMQPTLEKADLLMLTKNVCDAYRLAAANKRISIEFKANAPEVLCLADSRFITQIADNLISNALKYSPSHTTIAVRTLHIVPDDLNTKLYPAVLSEFGLNEHHRLRVPSAVLLVRDQGPGLSDDDKDKLYQKFARLSAQPTGGEHSTGLGLSIVKRLAESMNAEVWCESVLGAGAMFAVAFPLAESSVLTEPSKQTL